LRNIRNLFVLFIIGLTTLALRAQEAPITVTTAVDQVRMTIGDLLTYSVTVSHVPEMEVELPGLGANLGGFQIRDYTLHDPEKEAGRIVKKADYVISTFFTGKFDIPPIAVFYRMPGDSTYQSLMTEKMGITVESVQEGEEQAELLDIKPPEGLPYNYKRLIFFVGLGLFVIAAVVAAILIHRRHKAGGGFLPKAPPRPPHEIALEALDKLAASDLIAREKIKSYYIALSEIIRQYLEGRFYVQALELATWEIMDGMEAADLVDAHRQLLRAFLEDCDLVKFAKHIPDDAAHVRVMADARRFVTETQVLTLIDTPEDDVLPEAETLAPAEPSAQNEEEAGV